MLILVPYHDMVMLTGLTVTLNSKP